jgi:hypothetical protein
LQNDVRMAFKSRFTSASGRHRLTASSLSAIGRTAGVFRCCARARVPRDTLFRTPGLAAPLNGV